MVQQKAEFLGWTNKKLSEISKVPDGTLSRIKAGEDDCKYSTMKNLLIALIGGTIDEFSCTEQVEKELQQKEQFEQQAAKLSLVEAENERLINRFKEIDEIHRKDVRAIKEEYNEQISFLKEQNAFLKEQLKAWQSR